MIIHKSQSWIKFVCSIRLHNHKQKIAKTNKDGRFICANKGCVKRTFTDEENDSEDTPCNYH